MNIQVKDVATQKGATTTSTVEGAMSSVDGSGGGPRPKGFPTVALLSLLL